MITQALIDIAQTMRPAAGILLLCAWWPHRKSGLATSIPWIILYFVLADIARRWTVLSSGRLLHAQTEGGFSGGIYEFLVFISFLSQLRYLVIAVMLAINVSFLLKQVAPVNRFQSFLARQQRFQHLIGVLLLLLLFAPILVAWIAIHFIGHPGVQS